MPVALDVTGQRFQCLTAVRKLETRVYPAGQRRTVWLFRCDCGTEVEKTLFDVRRADTKSCGCMRKGRPSPNRREAGESSFSCLLHVYKARAKKIDIEWSISEPQFRKLTKQNCYYCGCAPAQEKKAHRASYGAYIYNGLDRLNSDGGYTLDNVVPACGRCNQAKNDMTRAEFIAWIASVYQHLRLAPENTATSGLSLTG